MVTEKDKSHLRKLEESIREARREEDEYRLMALEEKLRQAKKELDSPAFSVNPSSPIRECDLVVLDECSMISERMGRDLLSFKVPILVLGDPYQLPPVKGAGFFTNGTPDVLLEQVHRQAQESGVLRFATDLRNGMSVLTAGHYGDDVQIVTKAEFREKLRATIRPPTQVLVGLNETRNAANDILRGLIGLTSRVPQSGDRVICLRNNHEAGLLNGAQFDVLSCTEDEYLRLGLQDDGGNIQEVKCHREIFERKDVPWQYAGEAEHFDFANAITCHKAQGSEWDDVVVVDESRRFGRNRRKWQYTAATRAAKTLTWVTQ
jgi:exodeoxyribonuclease-5